MFKEFKTFVEKQTWKKIKALRIDNDGEFKSKEFQKIWTFTTFITNIYTVYVGAKQSGILVKSYNCGSYIIRIGT
jgi:hypothetical protein